MRYLCVLFMVVAAAGCGGDLKLDSCWRSVDVVIDGDNTEWAKCATYVEDEGFAVGVMNDADYLYISLSTADREVQRQVMMSGMTAWLDVTNDKTKGFGIRFPLGMRGVDTREQMKEMREASDPPDRAEMQERFKEQITLMDQYETIGPHEGNIRLMHASDSETIAVTMGVVNGAFIYELRVSLRQETDYLYGLDVGPGDTIGIGLDSPELDMGDMRGPMSGMDGGMGGGRGGGGVSRGGMPGGGGKGGGGGGMHPNGGSFERPEPFEVWASVSLVSISDARSE
jgi:uncharacterized membrane protein YgcG